MTIALELTSDELDNLHEAVDSFIDMIGDEWEQYYEEEEIAEQAEQNFKALLAKIVGAKS